MTSQYRFNPADISAVRTLARVLDLLDASFAAHSQGERQRAVQLIDEAAGVDRPCVEWVSEYLSVGALPRPDDEPEAWRQFVGFVKSEADRLSEAST